MSQLQNRTSHSSKNWENLPTKKHHLASTLYSDWCTHARREQIPIEGDWNIWLILAGRGWGKTKTGAMDVISYGLANPESQIAVVVPTFGDLRRVAFGQPNTSKRSFELLLRGGLDNVQIEPTLMAQR